MQYMPMNLVTIGLDNGLSPIMHQAILRTNADLFSMGTLEKWSKYDGFH